MGSMNQYKSGHQSSKGKKGQLLEGPPASPALGEFLKLSYGNWALRLRDLLLVHDQEGARSRHG